MAEEAQRILDSIANKPYLNLNQKEEGYEVPAKFLVHYSMERCRKQKLLCSQLRILRFLLEFLQEASTVSWEDTNPELLSQEEEKVRQKWKGLKLEYQNKVEEVEELLPHLLEKIQLLQEKKTQLEDSFQRYQCKERCRKQKLLCSQLRILRFLLEFLQEASTVSWEDTNPELLSQEEEKVRQKWKGLKLEYQNKVEEVEELLPHLLEKIQLLQEKKTQLEDSFQRYQCKRTIKENQAKQELDEALKKQQQAVQKCQDHIQLLKVEVEKLEQSVDSWIRAVDKDSTHLDLLNTLQGMSVVSVGDKELVLDLYAGETTAVTPLRVNVHLTSEGQFHMKTEDSMPGLPSELQRGDTSHITSVIMELQCWHRSHGQLLAEMRDLQDRFAIDWLPVERQILLLKGSTRYTLHVEPGYPQSGRVNLLSVKGLETGPLSSHFKPPGYGRFLVVLAYYAGLIILDNVAVQLTAGSPSEKRLWGLFTQMEVTCQSRE
ncbi:PREDICTED: ZW10 interactor [Nanorana parkeri]|uniref:ZW10 interactor n=1 Tax=Nanorana parkeri TaxID=125878 RepID=UPI00085472E7|nr:PREDICTED: ZW10 interactor [Nanorana parkeri]